MLKTSLKPLLSFSTEINQASSQSESSRLSGLAKLSIFSEPVAQRRSSIICTVGPETGKPENLLKLRKAGMNVMRLNFSHGSHEFHGQLIKNLRESFVSYPGPSVAIALDTKGPEIRTGLLADGIKELPLSIGDKLMLSTDKKYDGQGSKDGVYVDYVRLPQVVSPGDTIYVDDGLINLTVLETGADFVLTRAEGHARLGARKGVNLPNIDVDLPALSEKDKFDLQFAVEQDVDIIFASFIRKADDIHQIRSFLGEEGKDIILVAKIENYEGVRNFHEIAQCADGVMVARGDMGIEIPPEKVFLAQKALIATCNTLGKPVICATQMLESMTYNPRPTRAEVSDVANAILDGADCVMLSGETAKGDYPVESVVMMHKICLEAESSFPYQSFFNDMRSISARRHFNFGSSQHAHHNAGSQPGSILSSPAIEVSLLSGMGSSKSSSIKTPSKSSNSSCSSSSTNRHKCPTGSHPYMRPQGTNAETFPLEALTALETTSEPWFIEGSNSTTESVAIAAVDAAFDQRADAIVVLSTTGKSARMICKYRPFCPVVMVTRNKKAARQANLYRGVVPLEYPYDACGDFQDDVDRRIQYALIEGAKAGFIRPGGTIVAVQGWRSGVGFTNTLRLLRVPHTA